MSGPGAIKWDPYIQEPTMTQHSKLLTTRRKKQLAEKKRAKEYKAEQRAKKADTK